MKQFLEGLKKIPLSQRTQNRIKLFKENVHQIYHLLEQPRPYFIKQSIISGNSIKCIEQEKEHLEVANNGVIVGRIYKVLNPSKSLTDDENLSFKGSCFFVTNYIAVCCSHQVIEDNKFVIRIDGRFLQSSKLIQLVVKKVYHNSFEKTRPGEQKSQDYAFLNVEMESWLKNSLRDRFTNTLLTTLEGIENSMFNFDATIYGYFEKVPKQFQDSQQWSDWRPNSLIKSSGVADYSNKGLSYTVSTDFGFSGAPIVLEYKGKYHIMGIHTRGSHFHSKNYGILFSQRFFDYLQQVINELLKKEKGYNSLQQTLNIASLTSIVKYKRTFKSLFQTQPLPDLSFIEKALEKIINKIAQLEEAELVLEQLSLQDIIISSQSKNDFLLDFTRLRLSEYIQKGTQISNLDCISMLIIEIQAARKQPLIPKCKIGQMNMNEEGFIDDNQGQQTDKMISIIAACLSVSYQQPLNIYYKKTKFLLDLITFVPRKFSSIQQYYLHFDSLSSIKQIELNKRGNQLAKLTQMTGFNLNQHMFRKKFMNLMKYSVERLSDRVIARAYLVKLCSFYNQLLKVIRFLQDIAKKVDGQIEIITSKYLGASSLFQSRLRKLLDFPDYEEFKNFTFFSKKTIFQEDDRIKTEEQIQNTYKQMLENQRISFSQNQIDRLVRYQYIFCRMYVRQFEQLLQQVRLNSRNSRIASKIQQFEQKDWQQKMKKILLQQSHQLKKNSLNQQPFNIYEAKIFKEIFIDYEHTVFNKSLYKILDMTPAEEKQYEEILNILVQIRDKNGSSKGTGFFLNKDTICTTRHIFEGQDISSFLIVNKRAKLKGQIISSEICINEKHLLCSDIIFLKVQLLQYVDNKNEQKILHFSDNVFLMDNDMPLNSKQFEGKNNFGLLIGFRKIEGSNQIRPTKSYGQIQMNSEFHPLIGDHHLSGSPIIMRIAQQLEGKQQVEYKYVIVGVYSGVQSGTNGFSGLQRFKALSFNVQESFLKNIEFPRLSQCMGQFRDQIKQFIVKIYSSLDHFLLRVMGQVLRLNSLNIYLEDLAIHNILFGSKLLTDIQFSRLPIRLHLQYLDPDHRQQELFEKIKLQLERRGTNIFSRFIKSSYQTFDKDDNFVLSSVLINHLQMLEKSGSLVEFYKAHLQGKYFFDKESCSLQPLDNQLQQILPSKPAFLPRESKFQKIFKSAPAEHLARIQLGYNILKNTTLKIEDIMLDNRRYLLSQKYLHDVQKLINCTQDKINKQQFYFLAKKILQDAIKEASIQLMNKQPSLENDEMQEFNIFKEQYMSYIKDLTHFSNLNIMKRNDFKFRQQRNVKQYYKLSKNWSMVSDILDLYNQFKV